MSAAGNDTDQTTGRGDSTETTTSQSTHDEETRKGKKKELDRHAELGVSWVKDMAVAFLKQRV